MAQNALGKHFREGISLIDLFKMFPDDKTAEQWSIKTRWPDGIACPRCGSVNENKKGIIYKGIGIGHFHSLCDFSVLAVYPWR